MNKIDSDALVDLLFSATWSSDTARHTECYQANQVNVWRDFIPEKLFYQLQGKQTGDQIKLDFNTSEIIEPFNDKKLFIIKRNQMRNRSEKNNKMALKLGRFYPLGIVDGLPGVFSANVEPFRCTKINNGHVELDLNHPLAGKNISVTTFIGGVEKNKRSGAGRVQHGWKSC